LTVPIIRSLTNAKRSATQAAPPSAGYNGLQVLAMIMKMRKKRRKKKRMRKRKRMRKKMTQVNLCGEK